MRMRGRLARKRLTDTRARGGGAGTRKETVKADAANLVSRESHTGARPAAGSAPCAGAGHGPITGKVITNTSRAGACVLGVLALAAIAAAGCNLGDDFAESLVEKTAKRNEERRIEQQREALPLPDPSVVPFVRVANEDLDVNEDFHVDLVDDLVIGAGRTEPEYLFVSFGGSSFGLGNVAVDEMGRIYVLDTRNSEVRVFDRDGGYLFAFGRPGEGPGDFQRPFAVVIAGGEVSVYHRNFFTSIWSLTGEHLDDRRILEEAPEDSEIAAGRSRRFRSAFAVAGRPDGSTINVFRAEPQEPSGRVVTPYVRVIARLEGGREVQRYMEIPEWAGPSLAVAANGEMYVGMFGHLRSEHYIVALDAAGEPRFTLVTPWHPALPPRAELRVDGEGRLYVFPGFQVYYAVPPEDETDDEAGAGRRSVQLPDPDPTLPAGYVIEFNDPRRPVQVYTRDGELIGSGYLNRRPVAQNWQVADRAHVYGVRVNPVTEEWEVVRYRLALSSQ